MFMHKISFKQSVLVSVSVLLVVIVLFLIGYNVKKEQSITSELPELRVGYIPITDAAQLYVANDLGIFNKHGIVVKTIAFTSGAKIIQALSIGELDVGFTGTVPLIQANSRGLELKAITGGSVQNQQNAYQALVVSAVSDIFQPQQLEGKTIGINAFKSIDHAFTLAWLEKHKVNLQTTKFVEIPFPQMEAALSSGQIQASSMIEPYITIAEDRQALRILDHHIVDIKPEFEMTTYVVSASEVNKMQKEFKAFQSAINEATDLINQGNIDLTKIISENIKLDEQTTRKMIVPSFDNELTMDNLKFVSDMLINLGFIEKTPDLESLVLDLN